MKFFLSSEFQSHRRGRFLAALLGAESLADGSLPYSGLLFVAGEHFQASASRQQDYWSWARQPGCSLLLLPPWQEGRISEALDWSIGYSTGCPVSPTDDSVAALVAAEVIYRIEGDDGASEAMAHHLWSDHSSHTRYWKAHSNSGLIAATTLPLWSISLINQGLRVRTWLEWLDSQAGMSSVSAAATEDDAFLLSLSPHDYTVLVCCHGLNVSTPSTLSEAICRSLAPIINLSEFDLPESFARLRSRGWINESGLTAEGLDVLKTSQYWGYAQHLKGVREP